MQLKSRTPIRLFSLGLLLALSSHTQAASLLSVYQSARLTDPTYNAAIARAKAGSESKAQAVAALLPQLSASAYMQSIDSEPEPATTFNPGGQYDYNGYEFTLTQSILRFDQFAQLAIGKLQAKQAEIDLVLAEQELIARASQAYFGFLSAKTDLDSAKAERESIASQLEQAEKRFEVGLIAKTDVQENQARYDLADAQLILAELQMENAKDLLREIAGQSIDALPDLKADMPLQPPEGDSQTWVSRALQQNPQLLRTRLDLAIADKRVDQAQAGHLPRLNAQAQYSFDDTSERAGFGSETTDQTLSLQLSLPLFSGGATRSKVRQAQYQLQASESQQEGTKRSIERQTRAAYRNVISSIRSVKALNQAVLSNRSALEATEAGYDVGTRTTTDVLNTRSALFRAQRDYANARYNFAISLVDLYRVEGSLSPEHLVQLNSWLSQDLGQFAQ